MTSDAFVDLKASFPNVGGVVLRKVTEVNMLQLWNAPCSIFVTLAGMSNSVNRPRKNAYNPMVVNVDGNEIVCNPVSWNAL